MRFIAMCCAVVALPAAISFAQSVSDVIPADQRMHDFGAVAKASKTEHRFILNNPFQSEMRVAGVRASCGCTTPILESQTIKPGESVGLVAHFNTDRFSGDKKATLTISISQPIRTELQLNVKGYIRTDIVLTPVEAAFGSVQEDSQRVMNLTLDYAGRSDWQIVGVSSPFSFVKASYKEQSRGNGRVRYEIQIELDSSAPEGHFENQVVFQTNDIRLTSFPITVSASVDRPLKSSPASLALGSVKPGEPIKQRITMTAKSEFMVLAIDSDIAEVQCELPTSAKRVQMLDLTLIPSQGENPSGHCQGCVRVLTDSAQDKPIRIPLTYTIETEKFAGAIIP